MLFSWLTRRRRRRRLAEPFPAAWPGYLHANMPHYRYLAETERAKLRDDLRIFIAEKHWEGCRGLEVTDEMKVTIAAHACLLVLGLEHDYYQRVPSVLIYPGGFRVLDMPQRGTSLIDEAGQACTGQSWYRGPVVLAWDELLDDCRHPARGRNLVFHEFAHQLDMLDGEVDGTPPLADPGLVRRWPAVMQREYERLARASDEGRVTLLDPYGATDEAEFFAVATECFFTRPAALRRRHPQLYEVLRAYYRQDPVQRFAGLEGDSPAEETTPN